MIVAQWPNLSWHIGITFRVFDVGIISLECYRVYGAIGRGGQKNINVLMLHETLLFI